MKAIGLYIHIPFCDGKCAYCNFFSIRGTDEQLNIYTDAVIERIVECSQQYDRVIDTVYFGGGTPSILGANRLCRILSAVQDSFELTDDTEITVEVNPASSGELDFERLYSAGFNRLSIGLQSSNDTELQLLGRRHTSQQAKDTVAAAQTAGFENISLDLMLAIPGQTIKTLSESIRFCADCGVQHISSYILKYEPGTPFYAKKDELDTFSDDDQAALYEAAVDMLQSLGYMQYEVSNFCREDCESRHNLHYWRDEEYIGIGPSAHSFMNGKRFCYPNDFDSFYKNRILFESTGGDRSEYIMLALRLREGLRYKAYAERFNEKIPSSLLVRANVLEQNHLVEVSSNEIRLTTKGFLVSNAVIAYLLENI